MAKLKLKSKREYLPVAEVADQYESTPDELYAEAAIGELTIYVKLDQEQAGVVYSERSLKPMPQIDGEILIDKISNTNMGLTLGGDNQEPREFHRYRLFGLQPIKSNFFSMTKDDRESINIELEDNKIFSLVEHCVLHSFIQRPLVKLQDALDSGKLFVRKADLGKLISNESTNQEDVAAAGNMSPAKYTLSKTNAGLPAGVNNHAIASAFDGIFWMYDQWKRNLGDPSAWLVEARLSEGKRGSVSSTWNPVLIAVHLQDKRKIPVGTLNKAFRDNPSLRPWEDEWHETQSPFKNTSK